MSGRDYVFACFPTGLMFLRAHSQRLRPVRTLIDGTWWFTVRWYTYTPLAGRYGAKAGKPRKQYDSHSLNLWEKDLERLELAAEEEIITDPPSPRRLPSKAVRPIDPWKLAQLRLPFDDS